MEHNTKNDRQAIIKALQYINVVTESFGDHIYYKEFRAPKDPRDSNGSVAKRCG